MKSPSVSVIIPIYNSETYIEETLNSICNQTLQNIEIIVINDGSTDQSLQIINHIANKDQRIQVYTQTNQGVSIARNLGIQHAQGEYIYFIDSDDTLVPEALEICLQECNEQKLDFTFFDAENIICTNEIINQNYIHHESCKNKIWKGIDILNLQLDTSTYRIPVWLNFTRYSYIKQLNLTFYPKIIHEDQLFTTILYLNASRVSYIPKVFVKRKLRKNSIMSHPFSWENIRCYLVVIQEILKYKENKSIEIQATINKYIHTMLNAITWNAHTLSFKEKCHFIYSCINRKIIKDIAFKSIIIMFLKSKKKL